MAAATVILSKTTGGGNDTVLATFTAHTGRIPRPFLFTVKNTTGSKPTKQITITEESPGLTASFVTESLAALAAGGTLDLQFQTNAKKFRFDISQMKGILITATEVKIDSTVIVQESGVYTVPGDPGVLSDFVVSVKITIALNSSPLVKSGTLGIVAVGNTGQADVSKSIPITQAAGESTLSVTPESATIPASGGSVDINIQSNDLWNIAIEP